MFSPIGFLNQFVAVSPLSVGLARLETEVIPLRFFTSKLDIEGLVVKQAKA